MHVRCLLGGKSLLVDRHPGGLRERAAPSRRLESLLWGISSGLPLASHLAWPGSEPGFGPSQRPPVRAWASRSQEGFQERGLWIGWPHSPFDLQGALPRVYSWHGLLDLENRAAGALALTWAGLRSSSSPGSTCPLGTRCGHAAWGPSVSCLPLTPGELGVEGWEPSSLWMIVPWGEGQPRPLGIPTG